MPEHAIDRWIRNFGDRRLVLTIGGRVFGGRPGESTLMIGAYSLTDDELVLRFREDAELVVTRPSHIRASWREFIVPSCERAVLSWSGGETRRSIVCEPSEDGFVLVEHVEPDGGETTQATRDVRNAVKLLPVP